MKLFIKEFYKSNNFYIIQINRFYCIYAYDAEVKGYLTNFKTAKPYIDEHTLKFSFHEQALKAANKFGYFK